MVVPTCLFLFLQGTAVRIGTKSEIFGVSSRIEHDMIGHLVDCAIVSNRFKVSRGGLI